jgi:hypothetical protein
LLHSLPVAAMTVGDPPIHMPLLGGRPPAQNPLLTPGAGLSGGFFLSGDWHDPPHPPTS